MYYNVMLVMKSFRVSLGLLPHLKESIILTRTGLSNSIHIVFTPSGGMEREASKFYTGAA